MESLQQLVQSPQHELLRHSTIRKVSGRVGWVEYHLHSSDAQGPGKLRTRGTPLLAATRTMWERSNKEAAPRK